MFKFYASVSRSFASIDALRPSSVNAIYSRTKCSFSEMISGSLFKSCCLPLNMYATEAIVPNKSNILKLDNLINVCIQKFLYF